MIFVLEDDQRLVGDAEHVERPKTRCVMGALCRSHQTGLMALRPTSQTGPGKIFPGGHEFADLFLLVNFFFRGFGLSSPIHGSSYSLAQSCDVAKPVKI